MLRTISTLHQQFYFVKSGVSSPVVPYSAVSPRDTGDNGARYLAALSSSAHKYVTDSLVIHCHCNPTQIEKMVKHFIF